MINISLVINKYAYGKCKENLNKKPTLIMKPYILKEGRY
jgi:hypothetical protein